MDMENLIESVRDRKPLWGTRDPRYHHRDIQRKFWNQVAQHMNEEGAMRFNDRQMCLLAQATPDLEDRLSLKRKSTGSFKKEVFKHRWFRLKYNMLFYFKIADTGRIDEEPDGVIILANCKARLECDGGAPFTFSLTFGGAFDKIIIIATRNEEALSKWISAINNASYELLRQRVSYLQQQLALNKN